MTAFIPPPSSPVEIAGDPILRVRDLMIEYQSASRSGLAVDGLSFDIGRGEILAIVGESGCGKSTTALAIAGLLPKATKQSGEMTFAGDNLLTRSPKQWQSIRGNQIGIIFQEPMTSLNPVYTIGYQVMEILSAHRPISRRAAKARVQELFDLVSLPDPNRLIDRFPHELSGGQRQRVMIAMAIALNPKLLVADEPTTALDATVQRQIIELLGALRRELDMAVLLISHDLGLVGKWADRVMVMHHGQKMEELAASELVEGGRHAYTRGLAGASIRITDDIHYTNQRLAEIRATRAEDGHYLFGVNRPALPANTAPTSSGDQTARPLLEVKDLVVRYPGTGRNDPAAVRGVSFDIRRGETLGLVGESGSGKSSLSRAVMRLVPIASGTVRFEGTDITRLEGGSLRKVRPRIQMVFQDPVASLNPRHRVEDILGGTFSVNNASGRVARNAEVARALDLVGLPKVSADKYPHEFSGGQRQRIAIARALIQKPSLIICDEPVSALDVSVQAQILNLLADLKAAEGLSYLFISHDLAVIKFISDQVMVMKAGELVETADQATLWSEPQHGYTRTLIEAVA
ncbi:ABC transporter ATP-binding protein [Agrobacterium vitis]|uniref:Dipeptide ABC transporter ATP-binding protein n=1 Tax=Agrobacterium vitis TaxID=373 RepID=A0ABW9THN0_AGRVI|nr:ABC transporter ATP-binding protein [Agrobacterium vitis]MUO43025.1 dipeptide ABC transporter ATP-binding protein [Agrobacterium vitis]